MSGALLGPEGPAGNRGILERVRRLRVVSWSGPALVIHIGLQRVVTSVVLCGCWWWSLGVGAGCLLRTAQWTRTSFSSGVRRVDNPLMIGPLRPGAPSWVSGWVVRVFVVWVQVYRLDLH